MSFVFHHYAYLHLLLASSPFVLHVNLHLVPYLGISTCKGQFLLWDVLLILSYQILQMAATCSDLSPTFVLFSHMALVPSLVPNLVSLVGLTSGLSLLWSLWTFLRGYL